MNAEEIVKDLTYQIPPERLIVGKIARPWGTRGQVKIEVLTDFPERFRSGVRLFIGSHSYLCEYVTRPPKSLILKLQGVESVEDALLLRDALLEVPTSEAEVLPEGTYYYYQILGLDVYTSKGEHLGQVADILATGSNDVYVVRGARGEVLVPATPEVIVTVDLSSKHITIEPILGLF